MQLRPEQLDAHLKKTLAPVYFLTGDDPLLMTEAADALRAAARARGFADREVLSVESGFDWDQLLAAAGNLSLFAEQRILELRLPTGKPGDAGAKALRAYVERPPEDTVLIILAGKLDASARKSKWVQALEQAGVMITLWPVDVHKLPAWIRQRMQGRGLKPEPEAVALLAERVEGNLMAAAQEIEKLLLLQGPGPLSAAAVQATVADSARFDVFGLVDTALAGEVARSQRMLVALRGEGVEPVLILWALAREIRSLAAMAREVAQGTAAGQVLAKHRVWESRKQPIGAALGRLRLPQWQRLLRQAAALDRIIKGQAPGNPWDELVQLTLRLAGLELRRAG
jgi:DNA polymerase-3 subunit delta